MSLAQYKQKRDFHRTSEPAGSTKRRSSKQLEFVVQKHNASHLHYDFRLEMEGVLKSWAVPKGPSLNPEDKRLAMMTEDHPYDYRTFEGTIPAGNYGAGEVIVWDNGTYEPLHPGDNPEKQLLTALAEGNLKINLHGKKLQGAFALVKQKKAEDNAWLLIKKRDQYASKADITQQVDSVISHRTLEIDSGTEQDLEGLPKSNKPANVKPMLATLTDGPFDDHDWLYEIKWDGYRAIGSWDGHSAELYSRNGNDFSRKYGPISEALRQLKHQVVLDGEVVVLDEKGRSRFELLQDYGRKPQGALIYYVFDLLWLDGHDLQSLPLIERKELLKQILPEDSRIRYSDHIREVGTDFFHTAEQQQLEGIMAKQCSSKYRQGFRSKQWLKIKTHLRQEVVIGGFTEPRGSRKHIGALLVGIYEGGQFKYVGHVGTGIPPKLMPELRERLDKLEADKSPFADSVKPNAPVHWVKPEMLCEVTFSEWTEDRRMRIPVFVGLRSDKPAKEVKREMPTASKPGSSRVKFSHLDKVFWPEAGYTKQDLVNYYKAVRDFIMPYIMNRPHSLFRQPHGYQDKGFFQKDVAGAVPDWVETVGVYSESNEKDIHYFVAKDFEHLQQMVQLGCIEINPWSSTVKNLHQPDWVVLDLDPEAIGFKSVVKVALVVNQLCDELGIPNYPKTSGKTGIHIYIPTGGKYTYEQLKTFAELLANMAHQRIPDITSVERRPAKRQGKIYIDFLQNREGQTLAAPYSVRPTKAASVSTPLYWDEVTDKLSPEDFTIKTAPERFKSIGDIWKPVLREGIDIAHLIEQLS
jgi:bifunctional non-homologous end joining protein LigD